MLANIYRVLCFCLSGLLASSVQAADSVEFSRAWVRATAPGQEVGAAYMTLKSSSDVTLTRVESPVAGSVEIHNMSMKNGVMEMRMMETLPLSAGKPFKLEPGGFHLMLFDLKKPLKAGEKVSFTLQFKDHSGNTSTRQIAAPIKTGSD